MQPSQRSTPLHVLRRVARDAVIRGDDVLDAVRRRASQALGTNAPRHIAAYRGWGDAERIDLLGRVLGDAPLGGPGESDGRWENLLNTFRRFESDEVPGVPVQIAFGGHAVAAVSDHEGYYQATLPGPGRVDTLWAQATVSMQSHAIRAPQPVMLVHPEAGIGVISDIDDTILQSGITNWKVAAQLTFLQNARTRKPLKGVSKLYQALQHGVDGAGRVPIFYVSSSPWNLYDLLEDFMELNAIPPGPIFLRDLGTDTGKFFKTRGHGHKLDRARELIQRFPHLRWVLLGDSGQADAELYSQAAVEFGSRIVAIYIRDVDPDLDSAYDKAVGAHIERVAGTNVPMMLAKDSSAIAAHAAQLGLIDPKWIPEIEREIGRDESRPTLGEAATEAVVEGQDSTAAPPSRDDTGVTRPGGTPPGVG